MNKQFWVVVLRWLTFRGRYELSYGPGSPRKEYHFNNYNKLEKLLNKHRCDICKDMLKTEEWCHCDAEWVVWDYYKNEGGSC